MHKREQRTESPEYYPVLLEKAECHPQVNTKNPEMNLDVIPREQLPGSMRKSHPRRQITGSQPDYPLQLIDLAMRLCICLLQFDLAEETLN